MSVISGVIVGLALVPISAAGSVWNKPRPEAEPSVVARSLTSLAAIGMAASYWCAITALKTWAKLRPHRSAD